MKFRPPEPETVPVLWVPPVPRLKVPDVRVRFEVSRPALPTIMVVPPAPFCTTVPMEVLLLKYVCWAVEPMNATVPLAAEMVPPLRISTFPVADKVLVPKVKVPV